jgi:hypothetical protein
MLDSYVSSGEGSVPYGLEYLVTGKSNQKDAFSGVINRLFLIRTMLNYIYVKESPSLQAASLETATAIAAPLMAEAWIPVIQNAILLVLSMEESCVDICALLQGRRVPVLKNKSNFKMSYGEICTAGKSLFESKAKAYDKVGDTLSVSKLNQGLGYVHYVWLLLMMESWDTLYERLFDVLQYDLRENYNSTFTIDKCICDTKVSITYGMNLLYGNFLREKTSRGNVSGTVKRKITIRYGY